MISSASTRGKEYKDRSDYCPDSQKEERDRYRFLRVRQEIKGAWRGKWER